jgi:DNA polymerase
MIQQERCTVTPIPNPAIIRSSLAAYLEELRESGIEGFPEGASHLSPRKAKNQSTAECPGHHRVAAVSLPDDSVHHETLETIRRSLGNCQRCKLGKTRKNLVFGIGNPRARLVFVGEGPGADEDEKGEPFVGDAGRMLNRIISAMGLKREDVYICNVVKCRPPGNRNPETDEIESCSPFLLRQLKAVRPEAIVALGKFAAQTLLETKEPISKLRGRFRDFHGIPLMPTYHPSYLLRSGGNSDSFWDVWEDMTQVLQLLKLPVPEKSRNK